MGYLIFFVVAFILILLVYKLFVIRKENALNKMKKSKDVQLILKLSKVKMEEVDINKLINLISLANAFMIAFTGTIILLINDKIKNFYLWLLASLGLGMIVLLPLMIIIYKFIGKKAKKKEGK